MKNTTQMIEEYNNFKFISSCLVLTIGGVLIWVIISAMLSII